MYDCIIIGAGPAGLTAALYLLRSNKKVLVIDKSGYGGQIINASKIENYPALPDISGFDFATNLYNQVKKLGAELKIETVTNISEEKIVTTNNNVYKAEYIIIASGTQNRKLNLENEESLIGKGISYCATCDGNFYKEKTVAVVGGGNTALEDAIYLSNLASKVYLIHRKDVFKGEEKYIEEIKKRENIEIITNSNIKKINGDEKLESIEIIDNNGIIQNIVTDGLFIAIGQEPKNQIFSNLVDLDKNGYILTNDNLETKTKFVYAIGDAREKKLRQLTTAVSDGAIAASIIIIDLKK